MKTVFVIGAVLLLSLNGHAQIPAYELILANDATIADSISEFDMYIQGSGTTTFELASLQAMLYFNPGISSGTISLSMNSGSSQLAEFQQPNTMSIVGNELRINAQIPPGAGNGTVIPPTPGLRVGRFRLNSNVPYNQQSPAIRWKNINNPFTKVNAYVGSVNTAITDSLNHINDLGNLPLPVQLASFTAAQLSSHAVRLDWMTLSEINNFGFEVQKSRDSLSQFETLPNSFVPGHGTTTEPQTYSFTDSVTLLGKWFYRLRQIDLGGPVFSSEPIRVDIVASVEGRAPIEFALHQNFPNPFNPETIVKFSVATTAQARVSLFNLLGQRVVTFYDDIAEAGRLYKVKVNGRGLTSGVYYYRLESGGKSLLRKMLLLK